MTLSTALNFAGSGLAATARSAQVVSDNIANALSEDYSRRSLNVVADVRGGDPAGVRILGSQRATNPLATSEKRLSAAVAGGAEALADAQTRIAKAYGEPGEAGAIAERAQALENALASAAETPEAPNGLSNVLRSAERLTNTFAEASEDLRILRQEADIRIARDVERINEAVVRVYELNAEIQKRNGPGGDPSALEDQRKAAIDSIAEIIPIRLLNRSDGRIGIQAKGGAVLLDGLPRTLEFTSTSVITPDMTLASGALSGLTLAGRDLPAGQPNQSGQMDGGTLGAWFELRDTIVPNANATLDALARDTYERFADPAVDPTLAAGDPGLFTDLGAAFDPLNEAGFAGRIQVNAAIDPARGGDLWRIRDGIAAAAEGESGFSATLLALVDAYRAPVTPPPTAIGIVTGFSAVEFAGEAAGRFANAADAAETDAAFASARAQQFLEEERSLIGVDTDAELQSLLLIEQAYAANARVIQTADRMFEDLLSI